MQLRAWSSRDTSRSTTVPPPAIVNWRTAPTSEPSVPTLTGPLPPKSRPFAHFAARIRDVLILVGALTVVLWVGTYDWSDDPLPAPGLSAEAPGAGQGVAPLAEPSVALHTPEGFRRFVDAVRAEFGTTEVAQATVYADYASVGVPVPGSPGRVQVRVYDGGFGSSSAALTRDAGSRGVDLAVFDVDAVLGLVAGAGRSLNVENPDQLRVMFRDVGDGPRAMVEAFGDSGQYGWLEATADGTITEQHAFAPA